MLPVIVHLIMLFPSCCKKLSFLSKKIGEDFLHLLDFSNQRKFSSRSELLQFINCTLGNLRNLVRLKAGAIVSVRLQVKALIKKLRMFRNFVNTTGEQFFFSIDIQVWACKITFLSVLYWVDQMEEAMAARVKAILIDLMVNSYSPEFVALYLGVLEASKSASNLKYLGLCLGLQKNSWVLIDLFKKGKFIESFVSFILPIGYMNIIGAELMFLIACVLDAAEWDLISIKAKAVASEIPSLICSLTVGEMNENIVKERNVLLSDFREKTEKVKAEVRKFYVQVFESSWRHFRIANALEFMDSSLESLGNLMETLISKVIHIPFAKDQFVTLHKELVLLGPFLKKVQELEELTDLWMRISQVAYLVEYVIDSFQMKYIPICYNVIFLSDVIEEVKFIKREIQEIKHKQRPTNRILNVNGDIHLDLGHTDDIVIGFKDEAEKIIGRLTRGPKKLDNLSIVGMPGQVTSNVHPSDRFKRFSTWHRSSDVFKQFRKRSRRFRFSIGSTEFSYSDFKRRRGKSVDYWTRKLPQDVQKAVGLDKKDVIERSGACFQKQVGGEPTLH